MPIRPFPFPFRLGIDICQTSRINRIANKPEHVFSRFFRRLLTAREQKYCQALFPDMLRANNHDKRVLTEYLAGRWAAKEAAIKAVKPRRVTWQDIEIWPNETTKAPFAVILTEAAAVIPETSPSDMEGEGSAETTSENDSSEGVQTGGEDIATQSIDGDATTRQSSRENVQQVLHDILQEECDGQTARLSISHDGDYACAVVLALEEAGADDVGGEAAARELS